MDSARFPVFSPGAPVWTRKEDRVGAWHFLGATEFTSFDYRDRERLLLGQEVATRFMNNDLKRMDTLVDGGYFENSGAETLTDLLPAIREALPKSATLRVILIHNQPVTPSDLVCKIARQPEKTWVVPDSSHGESITGVVHHLSLNRDDSPIERDTPVSEPVTAMLNTRESRARLAMLRLSKALGCENVEEAYFQDIDGFRAPPLSWYLDEEMLSRMRSSTRRLLEDMRSSDKQLMRLGRSLRTQGIE